MGNILKYHRGEISRQVTSSSADYQSALDLSLLFSSEVELEALLEKILSTASTLLPACCGLLFNRFQQNINPGNTYEPVRLGSKAHHSMNFQLSHRARPVGHLTFYNRKRCVESELEVIEDLVSIVIQPLHVALRLQQASLDADNNRLLQQQIEQQLTRTETRQALLLTRIDRSDGDPNKSAKHRAQAHDLTRTRLMETLGNGEEEPWLEVCGDDTLVTLVSVEKAHWAAERIRLLVAAASETAAGARSPTVTIIIANLRNPGETGKLLQQSMRVLDQRGNRGNQIVKIQ